MPKTHRLRAVTLLFPALLLFTCVASAETSDTKDAIVRYFGQLMKWPQEKVYVHADRTAYSAGDRLWFRGYLANAVTHRAEDTYSNFVMVELISRKDSVVVSKKVRGIGRNFRGELQLPAALPAGYYYLRAYTNWMRNMEQEFFFTKLIHIGNAIDRTFTTTATYEALSADKIAASLHIRNTSEESAYRVYKVNYAVYADANIIARGSVRTDGAGRFKVEMPYRTNASIEQYLQLELDDEKYSYKTTLYPEFPVMDYAVSFFPEGGDLLALPNQLVAFKAQRADGFSTSITGVVKNESGEEVATLSTLCDGMGAFNLSAAVGDRFYVETTSLDGHKKRFELPQVRPTGLKITANRLRSGIAYELHKTDDVDWPDTLFVACHVRGLLRYLQIISHGDQVQDVIPEEYLNEGIAHLILLNKAGRAVSERLVFVKSSTVPELRLTPDKALYDKRDRVRLSLGLQEEGSVSLVGGQFSVSVTDKLYAPVDTLSETIQSSLLLTSDLKGFVENPGRYFLASNRRASTELNLLMLTHGWRRFRTDSLTVLPDSASRYYAEKGLAFSGRIQPVVGSSAGLGVTAMAASANIMLTAVTDNRGQFVLEGRDYPDSTSFVIRSRGRNDLPAKVIMDAEGSTPPKNNKLPYPQNTPETGLSEEALVAARDRYYIEGGSQITHLREVVVHGKRSQLRPGDPNYLYSTLSDRSYGAEWLEGREGMSAYEALAQLPGLTTTSDGTALAFQRAPETVPLLVIDGITYREAMDYTLLRSYSAAEIIRIDLMQYNAAARQILGDGGHNGAIVLTTNITGTLQEAVRNNAITHIPRGYNTSIEFYKPVYLSPQQKAHTRPDTRTTLHWDPEVVIDETGHALIEFYTDDKGHPMQVVVEGLTTDGRPVRLLQEVGR